PAGARTRAAGHGRRTCWTGASRGLAAARLWRDGLAPELGHPGVDAPVVAPLQEGPGQPGRDLEDGPAHGESPHQAGPRARLRLLDLQTGRALQVALHLGGDGLL